MRIVARSLLSMITQYAAPKSLTQRRSFFKSLLRVDSPYPPASKRYFYKIVNFLKYSGLALLTPPVDSVCNKQGGS